MNKMKKALVITTIANDQQYILKQYAKRCRETGIDFYIIGDKKHGDWRQNLMFLEKLNSASLLLHAATFAFEHPFTGVKIEIKVSLPENMRRLCKEFSWEIHLEDRI